MFATYDLLKLARGAALGIAAALLLLPRRGPRPIPCRPGTTPRPKAAIVAFVEKVTKEGSADFVPEPERIAVFDNDGTLWVEHPMYTQLAFALDRVKAGAAHPEWKDTQPFKAVLEGDMKTLVAPAKRASWSSSWRPMPE